MEKFMIFEFYRGFVSKNELMTILLDITLQNHG